MCTQHKVECGIKPTPGEPITLAWPVSWQVSVTACSPTSYCFLPFLAHWSSSLVWLTLCHSLTPYWPMTDMSVRALLCPLRPFLTNAFSYSSSSFTLSSHVLPHTLSTFLLAVSSADWPLFRVLLPFPFSPQGRPPSPPAKPLELVPQLLMPLPGCWKAPSLRPAFCSMEASSANSMWQEKLFMPFGNLIIGAGSDRLPGKEFPRTSSWRKKRKHISDVRGWFPYS